jgi:hypothetical protein
VVANEDTTKPRKVRHSPVARDSFAARGSSPYVPPNASFAQKDKVSSSSHHSGGPPPSVLRPQHASQPYREDSDDDAESGHIMGAWQSFPGPGPRSSYDRTSISTPHQHSNSGFSRIGGSRAHYDSPYAIVSETGGSSLAWNASAVGRCLLAHQQRRSMTMKNYLLQLLP